jgi:NTP pyrophosphatase (non-canonical NTP hydrolase)
MTLRKRGKMLISEFGLSLDPASRALDLSSEVGELCKEILKSTQYGTRDFQATMNLEMELGDAFFSLLTLATSVDVNLDAALEKALAKMRTRLEQTGQIGSGS